MDPLYPQLVRDALDVLDRYRAPIGKRDPVKSLDEDPDELLRRLRAALVPLTFKGVERRDDVVQVLRRIDRMHAVAVVP